MWPLLLIPIAAALFGKDSEDGALSPPTPGPGLPPKNEHTGGADCDWIYNADLGADDTAIVAAYAGLRNNPYAGPGDWYYFADVAESFGAHDVASCARHVGDEMVLVQSGG